MFLFWERYNLLMKKSTFNFRNVHRRFELTIEEISVDNIKRYFSSRTVRKFTMVWIEDVFNHNTAYESWLYLYGLKRYLSRMVFVLINQRLKLL